MKVPSTRLPPEIEVAQLKKTKTNREKDSSVLASENNTGDNSRDVSPARKTMQFIQKIAPSIKPDQKMPKFVSRLRA